VAGSPYGTSCSGAVDSDYSISYTPGTVTVTPKALTITASSATVTYGDAVPTITASYSGFVNGDSANSLSTKPTCTTAYLQTSHVAGSPYGTSCSGAVDSDYSISYTPGTVTVTPKALTITADNKAIIFGQATPTFTVQYATFVNGDTASSLGGTLVFTFTGINGTIYGPSTTPPTQPGTYSVKPSGRTSTDYAIGYVAGTFTIQYAAVGTCGSDAGRTVLQPVNPDGSSVFKKGSTVPVKFRVCDANGNSIGPSTAFPSVVTGTPAAPVLVSKTNGTGGVDEAVYSTTPDTSFRWDSSAQQWIYNQNTGNLVSGIKYTYSIPLNDGTSITYTFAVR
jgi:hypothetical protein